MGTPNFVNRSKERSIIEEIFTDISHGKKPKYQVVDFFGLPGIGKSLLLREVGNISIQHGYPCFIIDFVRPDYRQEGAIINICKEALRQIQGSRFLSDFESDIDNYWRLLRFNSSSDKIAELQAQILQRVAGLLVDFLKTDLKKPIVMILDTTELIQTEVLKCLEKEVINPCLSFCNLVIVSGGQQQTEWSRENVQVKKVRISSKLLPFNADDSIKQVLSLRNLGQDAALKIHHLTGGYPLANYTVAERFKADTTPVFDSDTERDISDQLSIEIIKDYIVGPKYASLMPIAETLSVTRRFEVNLLRELLIDKNIESDIGRNNFLFELIGKLQSARLADWEDKARAYSLELPIRKILSSRLSRTDIRQFLELHKRVADYYENLIETTSEVDKPFYLVELLYHRTTIMRFENRSLPEIYNWIIDFLESFLSRLKPDISLQIATPIHVLEVLKSDQDIMHIIGDTNWESVIDFIIGFIKAQKEQGTNPVKALLGIHKLENASGQYEISYSLGVGRSSSVKQTVSVGVKERQQILDRFNGIVTTWNELSLDNDNEKKNINRKKLLEQLKSIGNLTYRLFIHPEIQKALKSSNLPLVIETNDGTIPFELMHDGQNFLSVVRDIGRTLQSGILTFSERISRLTRPRILLIGDTDSGLPKPINEISLIEHALKDRADIKICVGQMATTINIMSELSSGQYDIIHYAGHSYFDPSHPEKSGLSCSGGGVLIGEHIERMLAGTGNPIVFINACMSAQHSTVNLPYLGTFSDGIIASFIRGGSAACIGALWPIIDETAAKISIRFYDYIISGNSLGEALRKARVDMMQEQPDDATWSSYILYGDPTFVLFN